MLMSRSCLSYSSLSLLALSHLSLRPPPFLTLGLVGVASAEGDALDGATPDLLRLALLSTLLLLLRLETESLLSALERGGGGGGGAGVLGPPSSSSVKKRTACNERGSIEGIRSEVQVELVYVAN